jgi:hypothetical protein
MDMSTLQSSSGFWRCLHHGIGAWSAPEQQKPVLLLDLSTLQRTVLRRVAKLLQIPYAAASSGYIT